MPDAPVALRAVLFDLDGTLADTAPDLGGALNRLRGEEGHAALPLAQLRPYVSQGVRGMLKAGFGMADTHADYPRLFERFLELYAAAICDETRLFDGIPQLLDQIEALTLSWGIVTNKRTRYTEPVVRALALTPRTRCVVSGDTTAAAKPSPLPVLHACELLGVAPAAAIYVGDDLRDIQAGHAAGCRTVAARFGYLGDSGPVENWGADLIIDHPDELAEFLIRQG